MTLAHSIGIRDMLTCAEVAEQLGLTKRQVEYLVESGQLKKAGAGRFAFYVGDVNTWRTQSLRRERRVSA